MKGQGLLQRATAERSRPRGHQQPELGRLRKEIGAFETRRVELVDLVELHPAETAALDRQEAEERVAGAFDVDADRVRREELQRKQTAEKDELARAEKMLATFRERGVEIVQERHRKADAERAQEREELEQGVIRARAALIGAEARLASLSDPDDAEARYRRREDELAEFTLRRNNWANEDMRVVNEYVQAYRSGTLAQLPAMPRRLRPAVEARVGA